MLEFKSLQEKLMVKFYLVFYPSLQVIAIFEEMKAKKCHEYALVIQAPITAVKKKNLQITKPDQFSAFNKKS